MRLLVRPSKIFVFDVLEKELVLHRGEVGLDAGSAQFKNRPLFHTKKYYGLDYNSDFLREGLAKHGGDDTLGILADLTNIKALPRNSVQVVVSTNTLYHLPKGLIEGAIGELARVTSPDGVFVLEIPLDDAFDVRRDILLKNFANIHTIYYKNFISQAYEGIFERDGFLGTHPIAGSKPFLALSWLLSRLEYPLSLFRLVNRHALIIASQKKGGSKIEPFDLSDATKVDDRIYSLIS